MGHLGVVGPFVDSFVEFHLPIARELYDVGGRALDYGLDGADASAEWARDRASDVGEGVRDVAGQVGDAAGDVRDEVVGTVADLGRGVLNLPDNPPWSR